MKPAFIALGVVCIGWLALIYALGPYLDGRDRS